MLQGKFFPVRVYNGVEDLAEPVYVYIDIKPNVVVDSYVRRLTTLHVPSNTEYNRFNYSLYIPLEQSFIDSITIRLVTKNFEDVLFESDIPCVLNLQLKKSPRGNRFQYVYHVSIYTVLCKLKRR